MYAAAFALPSSGPTADTQDACHILECAACPAFVQNPAPVHKQ